MLKNLLFKREIPINDRISIRIPTIGEIISFEKEYYMAVSLLTAMPVDMLVQLDDVGIDFTQINEYDLFLLMFGSLQEMDTSLIFGSLDLTNFKLAQNEKNGEALLIDYDTGIRIDRGIHSLIADVLRELHHLEKNMRKPANEEAKRYMIQRARKKLKRRMRKNSDSSLEELIVAMVNTEQFKYNFETVKDLTIYQFNESVKQVVKKVDYCNKMYGVYTGTISAKDLSRDDLNWLKH